MSMTVNQPGPLELLVLQSTPFCNINCSYCYLPNRQSTRRMEPATLDRVYRWVFSSGLVRKPLTLLWHAGEPLVLPIEFYDSAIDLLDKYNTAGVPVKHCIQTNATLLDEKWCDFFEARGVNPGVSIDGPMFLNDKHRVTRQGKGTFDRVMQGIDLLNDRGIPFGVITVLTADSLAYPDELFDFYQRNGIKAVSFNVEEIEGTNTSSSLAGLRMQERYRRFLRRFLKLALAANPPISVREFEASKTAIERAGSEFWVNENKPWTILNVDCEGNFSTWSPEMLGLDTARYGSLLLGNVCTHTLQDVLTDPAFQRMDSDIRQGVEQCRNECAYYSFCGGGKPVNKYFENGTFASTETLYCRLAKKVCLDVTLELLEEQQRSSQSSKRRMPLEVV